MYSIRLLTPIGERDARAIAIELAETTGLNVDDVTQLLSTQRRPLTITVSGEQVAQVVTIFQKVGLHVEVFRNGIKAPPRQLTHPPASAWRIVFMFSLVIALAVLGFSTSASWQRLPGLLTARPQPSGVGVAEPEEQDSSKEVEAQVPAAVQIEEVATADVDMANVAVEAPVDEVEAPVDREPVDREVAATEREADFASLPFIVTQEDTDISDEAPSASTEGASSNTTADATLPRVPTTMPIDTSSSTPSSSLTDLEPSLFIAARDASPAELRAAVGGRVVDMRDVYGQTPLMYAAGANSASAVEALLEAGADVNARSDAGWTALMYAARGNPDPEVVQALLSGGGDPSLRNEAGERVLDIARESGNGSVIALMNTALFSASRDADAAAVARFLRAGVDPNLRDAYGQTPLMYASSSNNAGAVSALLHAGADVSARSDAGWTALMYAAKDGHDEAASHLLAAGSPTEVQSGDGWTAQALAEAGGHANLAAAIEGVRASRMTQPRARTMTREERIALHNCIRQRRGCGYFDD